MRKKRISMESQRSMVEILGVLALVGLLSIAGIIGIFVAIDKNMANTIIHDSKMAFMDMKTPSTKPSLDWTSISFQPVSQKTMTVRRDSLGRDFVKVDNIDQRVCNQMLNMRVENVLNFYNLDNTEMTSCLETNDIIIDWNGFGPPAVCQTVSDCDVPNEPPFEGICSDQGQCQAYPSYQKPDDVVIAFAVDDNYALFLPVTIRSIEEHSNPDRLYQIFILGNNLSQQNKSLLQQSETKNIKIHLLDIADSVLTEKIQNLPTLGHINTATYYRFLIPEILKKYKKALYLEADQILLDDVAFLFDIDLKDKSLGVIPQPLYAGNTSQNWKDYCRTTLNMKNPSLYFNAGVLLMNLDKLRQNHFQQKAFQLAHQRHFRYLDQDILNFMFSNDCHYISEEWNAEIFILLGQPHLLPPKLLHYTNNDKPWRHHDIHNSPSSYHDLFWKYAKKTKAYPFILEEIHP